MDRRVIEEKLESLRTCVCRIETKRPDSLETLKKDLDLQDILTLNITRAVQLCVDIASHVIAATEEKPPETMGEAFDALIKSNVLEPSLGSRLKRAVGFRNVAVHNYRTVDWEIVHVISHEHLSDFNDFARAVMQALSGR